MDVAVIGEGELTLLELVQAYEQGSELSYIKGIAYQKDGEIIVNQSREYIANLDELPVEKQQLYNWQRNAAVLRRAV